MFAYLLVIEGAIFSYCITAQEWVWTGFMVPVIVSTLYYFRKFTRKIETDDSTNDILKKLAYLYVKVEETIPEKSLKIEMKRCITEVVYSACKGVNVLERWYDSIKAMGGREE